MELATRNFGKKEARFVIAGVASLVTFLTALHFYVQAQNDPTGYSWLWLLSCVQVLPFAIGVIYNSHNYINFILLSHFVGFSVAKWNEAEFINKTHALSKSWIYAVHELTICTVITLVSYYIARTVILPKKLREQKFSTLTLNAAQLRFIFFYILLVPLFAEQIPPGLLIIHYALANAQLLLVICAQSPSAPIFLSFIRGVLPFISYVAFIRNGFLTSFGNYLTFIFIDGYMTGRRRNIWLFAVLTVCVSAFQSVKGAYRVYLASDEGQVSSVGEKNDVLMSLLFLKYFQELDEPEEEGDELTERQKDTTGSLLQGFSRIGDDSLERVLALTPHEVPFWNGETYDSIPYMFIPRLFWPDKPGRHFWNKFGRRYRVLSEDDDLTSVSVGYLAEAYMNYGFFGMYLIAFLFGVFIVLVERLSILVLGGKFLFTYLSFMTPVIGLGADLGSILNSTVILTCVSLMIRPLLMRMARKDDYS